MRSHPRPYYIYFLFVWFLRYHFECSNQQGENMRITIIAIFAIYATVFTGCASTTPVQGALFADVKGPIQATSRPKGPLHGEACAQGFFGLVAMGDASISKAMENGGIRVVSHVEHKSNNIIGIHTFCTHVYGHQGRSKK